MEAGRTDWAGSAGLLLLRVGVAGYMITHGWGKLQMVLAGDFGRFGDPIGLGSGASLVLVTAAEFFCSLLVLVGFATRLAAGPVVFAMAVAAFVVHASDPWTMGEGAALFLSGQAKSWASKEPALLFLSAYLALMFTGAGRYSVDGWLGPKWRARRKLK
jgi:putative oxidoreductase